LEVVVGGLGVSLYQEAVGALRWVIVVEIVARVEVIAMQGVAADEYIGLLDVELDNVGICIR